MVVKKDNGHTSMVLNRNYVHASLMGHAIRFVKGQPVNVPNSVVREIVAIGGLRADGEDAIPEPEKVIDATPVNPLDREDAILIAFEALMDKNARDDFTGTGMPKLAAVTREAGFRVDKTELNKAWQVRADRIALEEADGNS